jgi:FAD/FMN-containing dehydrogenase
MDRVPLEHPLSPDEERLIDEWCARGEWPSVLARLGVEVSFDSDVVVGFARDQSNLPASATALARPANARECAAVLRACSRAGVPVTVSGGRTNLTGSATAQGGLVLSTVRMTAAAIVVDEAARLVTAPAGLILEDLRNDVLRRTRGTMEYPVNPTSRGECTVGGTIACNASGFVPGPRGGTREWV